MISQELKQQLSVDGAVFKYEVVGAGVNLARWCEVQERLREWVPQTELFVLAGANHALEEKDPRGVAEAMVPFLARHPIPTPV